MRIAIVGAGVAGGMIATGLKDQPGVEVLAFEKVGQDDHALAGNGLNVGPNAMLALDAAMPAMGQRLRACSLPWQQWRASTMAGELLYEVPLAQVASHDGIRIRWADLYRACRENTAGAVRYEAEVQAVHLEGERLALDVAHASGRSERIDGIDLLIAADGRYSGLRRQLHGTPPVTHLGVGNFRVLIDDKGGWPIEDLEQWFNGAHRLLAFRLPGGLVYISGNIPIEAQHDIPPEFKTADWLEQAYTPEDGTMAEAPRLLLQGACQAAREGGLHWSRLQEAPTRWHDESARVLFPGDAGHPMVPTLGQGATCAIEDAATFVSSLRDALAKGVPPDVPALVRGYAQARQDRIEFVRRFSWEASDVLVHNDPTLARVRAKGGADYRAKLKRLYGSA